MPKYHVHSVSEDSSSPLRLFFHYKRSVVSPTEVLHFLRVFGARCFVLCSEKVWMMANNMDHGSRRRPLFSVIYSTDEAEPLKVQFPIRVPQRMSHTTLTETDFEMPLPDEKVELYNPDSAAMLSESRCSMSPLDPPAHDYDKLRYVYDDYIEGGALRSGGAPNLFSRQYIGLVAQYAAVGFIDGVLPNVIYPFLQNYLNIPGSQTTTATVMVQLPWSFKVFYGIVSDCFPLWGYRRRPYMVIGWIVTLAMLLEMGLTPEGRPYFTDPSYREVKPEEYTPEIVATINYDAANQGALYIIPMMGCVFGYLMSDVCADGIVVELAQREPLEIRGRTQTVIYTTRYLFNILALILVAFCFNGDEYGGDFDFSLSFPILMLIVAVALIPMVPITWMFIYEERRPEYHKNFKHYMCELWDIVQTRAVYQYIAYQTISGIFAMFTWVSAMPIQTNWVNVSPLAEKIAGFFTTGAFAMSVWFAGNYGRDWDWRRTTVVTMVWNLALDATVKLLTIWDVTRSPWFWLGIPVLQQVPQGIIYIVGSFIIVELSSEGHEGAMYGLLTTVYNLCTPFSAAITRNVDSMWDLSTERIQNDSHGVRQDVTYTVLIMYAVNLFSLVFLVMLPRQKEQTQVMKRLGGSSYVMGVITVIYLVFALVWSVMTNIMSIYDSTACLVIAGGEGC